METKKVMNLAGGNGHAFVKNLIGEKEFQGTGRLFAEITLEPGSSVGYHMHHYESETYYILSGTGEYNDNGTIRQVKSGDVTFTGHNMGHGIINNSDEDLVFIGLILLYSK